MFCGKRQKYSAHFSVQHPKYFHETNLARRRGGKKDLKQHVLRAKQIPDWNDFFFFLTWKFQKWKLLIFFLPSLLLYSNSGHVTATPPSLFGVCMRCLFSALLLPLLLLLLLEAVMVCKKRNSDIIGWGESFTSFGSSPALYKNAAHVSVCLLTPLALCSQHVEGWLYRFLDFVSFPSLSLNHHQERERALRRSGLCSVCVPEHTLGSVPFAVFRVGIPRRHLGGQSDTFLAPVKFGRRPDGGLKRQGLAFKVNAQTKCLCYPY